MFIRIPDLTTKTQVQSTVFVTLEKLDLFGFALFAPAAVQFFLALEWGGSRYVWDSATIIGLFCGAAGTFCVFLAWEYRRGDSAMIPFSMVKRRIVWCSCLVMFLFMGSMVVTTYYMPIYFQTIRNATPTMSGVYILPAILSQIVFAIISGVLGMSSSAIHALLDQLRLQFLTDISWQAGVLPALEHCQRCFDIGRHRPDIDIHSDNGNWYLDRLPDSCRRWSWMWIADGMCRNPENGGVAFS